MVASWIKTCIDNDISIERNETDRRFPECKKTIESSGDRKGSYMACDKHQGFDNEGHITTCDDKQAKEKEKKVLGRREHDAKQVKGG